MSRRLRRIVNIADVRAGRVDLTKLHDALYSVENELNSLTLNGGKDKLLIFVSMHDNVALKSLSCDKLDSYGKVNGQINNFCGFEHWYFLLK